MSINILIINSNKLPGLTEKLIEHDLKCEFLDTIDKIMDKYNINKDTLSLYKGFPIKNNFKLNLNMDGHTFVFYILKKTKLKLLSVCPNTATPITNFENIIQTFQNILNTYYPEDSVNNNYLQNNEVIDTLNNVEVINETNILNDLVQYPNINTFYTPINTTNNLTGTTDNLTDTTDNFYTEQLSQLENMGFIDKQKNNEALFITEGDIDKAVNYLIQTI